MPEGQSRDCGPAFQRDQLPPTRTGRQQKPITGPLFPSERLVSNAGFLDTGSTRTFARQRGPEWLAVCKDGEPPPIPQLSTAVLTLTS